jgi:hypothetical protein
MLTFGAYSSHSSIYECTNNSVRHSDDIDLDALKNKVGMDAKGKNRVDLDG